MKYIYTYDNSTISSTSENVTVTVAEKTSPPQIVLTTTYEQSSSGTGSGSIHVGVNVSNSAGNPVVEIYDGTTLLATLTDAPYEYVYNNPTVGMHEINVKVSDETGGVVTATQNVSVQPVSTAISSKNTLTVNCYPTFVDATFVELNGVCTYQIQDMLGRVVESGSVSFERQIGMGLAAGQYIVVLRSEDKQTVVKLEKK